jgi:hypothetical protein
MCISERLNGLLEQLEAARIARRRRSMKGVGLLCILGVAVMLGLHVANADTAAISVAILCVLATAAVWSRYRGSILRAYCQRIMPELVSDISQTLSYQADDCISSEEFAAASLWPAGDRYSGRDLVHGRIGDTDIRFSVVHAEEEYETSHTDSDGKTVRETHYRTLFCGVFMSLDFNKHFAARTFVRPGAAGWLRRLSGSHVAMEDPRFNELFSVISSDQVEARYLLTCAMMARLVRLQDKLGAFHLSFCADRMYLAVDRSYDLFGPNMKEPFKASSLRDTLRELRAFADVVSDLDVDTRIWSKVPSTMDRVA